MKLGKIESAGDTMNAEGEKKDTELGRVKLKKATRTVSSIAQCVLYIAT